MIYFSVTDVEKLDKPLEVHVEFFFKNEGDWLLKTR